MIGGMATPASEPLREPEDRGTAQLRRRWSRGLWLGAAALVSVLVTFGLGGGGEATDGRPLPGFELTALSGDQISDHDLVGRVAVINVWASWCPPCRSEAPVLREAWADADPERVMFLGLVRNDNAADAGEFVRTFGLDYPNALDDVGLGRALGVRGLPTTYVTDAAGRIVGQHFGPITASRLHVMIEDALARGAPAVEAAPAAASSAR